MPVVLQHHVWTVPVKAQGRSLKKGTFAQFLFPKQQSRGGRFNSGEVVLKKYQPGCHFCGDLENLIDYSGVHVCQDCINYMHDESHRSMRKTS
jgi:hypothetical protein